MLSMIIWKSVGFAVSQLRVQPTNGAEAGRQCGGERLDRVEGGFVVRVAGEQNK